MPTNRKRMARGRMGVKIVLTGAQEWELLLGEGGRPSHFRDEEERRQAWQAHRERLLEMSLAGRRPWGWWKYECREERDVMAEAEQLVRLGVVDAAELAQIEARWAAEDKIAHQGAAAAARQGLHSFAVCLEANRRLEGIPTDRPELPPDDWEEISNDRDRTKVTTGISTNGHKTGGKT